MNKRYIILFVCLALVVGLIVLTTGVFVVKNINIEFVGTKPQYIDIDEAKVISSSKIEYNRSILVINETNATKNIEIENPYYKVDKIERHFPNKVTISISYRKPLLSIKIKGSNNYLILDKDFKILEIVDNIELNTFNITNINGLELNVDFDKVKAGMAIDKTEKHIAYIADVVKANNNINFLDDKFTLFYTQIDLSLLNFIIMKTNTGINFAIRTNSNISIEEQARTAYSFYDSADKITNEEKYDSFKYIVLTDEGWKIVSNTDL